MRWRETGFFVPWFFNFLTLSLYGSPDGSVAENFCEVVWFEEFARSVYPCIGSSATDFSVIIEPLLSVDLGGTGS